MQFEQVYTGWEKRSLTQEGAARILGVTDRTFRRYINRYDYECLEGLYDKCLTQASHRRAPLDEVLNVCNNYKERFGSARASKRTTSQTKRAFSLFRSDRGSHYRFTPKRLVRC